jgi:hypothetical protein
MSGGEMRLDGGGRFCQDRGNFGGVIGQPRKDGKLSWDGSGNAFTNRRCLFFFFFSFSLPTTFLHNRSPYDILDTGMGEKERKLGNGLLGIDGSQRETVEAKIERGRRCWTVGPFASKGESF